MFIKSSFIFSFFTLISRIFGFVRDSMLANYFGIGVFADAFNVAFRLPNLFRAIFAEGSFSAAFVPLFSSKLYSEGKESALIFAGRIISFLVLTLLFLMAIFQIFMPEVVMGIAPGFENDSSKFELTVILTRITTPYLFLISLVTFYACILNSIDRFAAMAASPIILNIIMIIGLYFFGNTSHEKTIAAAWSIVVGGVVQLIVILLAVYRKKHMPVIQMPKSDKDTSKFFNNLIPAIMGSGVTQINIWIGTIIATSIPGAVSIIYYADRIVQLPLSLIGVSISIVVLPKLSRMFKAQQKTKAIFLQNRSIELALALSMPCSVALYLIAEPIIYMLFQHGEFNLSDTAKTTPALIILGLGIPAYVLNKIIVSSYFANEDTKTPVKISAFTVLVNVIGNLILVKNYSYVGITAATAAAAWVNIFLLIFFAQKKQIFEFDRTFKFKLMKIIISCIFMYIFVESIFGLLDKYLYSDRILISLLSFSAIIFGAFFIYLLSIFATRAYTIKELKSLYFEN